MTGQHSREKNGAVSLIEGTIGPYDYKPLTKSMNSILKATRNLYVTALVRSTYLRLDELFEKS